MPSAAHFRFRFPPGSQLPPGSLWVRLPFYFRFIGLKGYLIFSHYTRNVYFVNKTF